MALKFLLTLVFLSFTNSAFAGGKKPFFDLFEIKRNSEGQVYEIKIRPAIASGPVKVVTDELKSSLILSRNPSLMRNPIPFSKQKFPDEDEANEFRKIVQDILDRLMSINLDDLLKEGNLISFLVTFEERLVEASRDFQVIARPYEPNYFHQNKVMKELLKRGLNELRDNFSGPVVGLASHIISESVRNLADRRTYYQNFVIHYLLNYEPEELGFTAQEVAWIMSSIRESKVAWDKPWDAWDIEDEWDSHGIEYYERQVARGRRNWKEERERYDSYGDMLNFSFALATQDGTPMIKNTINSVNKYSEVPATAFNYDKPCRQIAYRFVLRLVELGLSQVSMPGFVKRRLRRFISSLHRRQIRQEGYLAAFMLEHDMPEVDYIITQGYNVLVSLDHNPQISCEGGL